MTSDKLYGIKLTVLEIIEDLEALEKRVKGACPNCQLYTGHTIAMLKLMEQFLVNEMRKDLGMDS